jgi:2'-hydroxyisoflavone reductase
MAGPVPEDGQPGEDYGALKALAEEAAEAELPGRVLRVRAGLVVGPHDPTDRFTYWPRRIADGGPVLAAERSQPVQLIDARDLATFMVDGMEAGRTGVYNVTGPARPTTMEQLLATCLAVSGSGAEPVWVGEDALLEHGVEPWSELPLWLPAADAGFMQVDASRAREAGLHVRPLAETVADTLAWDRTRPAEERVDLLGRERERALLAALGL